MIIGAIEAGGTKFVCGIGDEDGNIIHRISFPTTTPEETLNKAIEYFKDKDIEALGVGSFGPIDLNKSSKTYGYITKTPKVGWNNTGIVGVLKKSFNIPIAFDTDVNGAALGELMWGGAKGLKSSLYITVGTGIGAGAVVDGEMVHGLLHPEMGHIYVRRHPEDNYSGKCIYHGDCLEGLAAGPAIEARWNIKGSELPVDHKAWDMEAYYLAQALVNFILILSPEKIILGGGVMKQSQLFPKIRKNVLELLSDYVQKDEILKDIDNYIIYPALGDNAGLCGALALALKVL